jgi:hypothetical protein
MERKLNLARLFPLLLAGATCFACAGTQQDTAKPRPSESLQNAPPLLHQWERNMVKWGRHWGEFISSPTTTPKQRLDAVYYDGSRVFYQIADYTGQKEPWTGYAEKAESIYIDQYVKPNDFKTAGYWRFPHGIYRSWEQNPGPSTQKALLSIRDKPAFSDIDSRDPQKWHRARYSREIAYAINAHITALKAGLKGREKALSEYVDAALDHLRIWRTGDFINPNQRRHLRKPFMFGLTGEALIAYEEYLQGHGRDDPRVIPALKATADWFWDNMWVDNVDGKGHGAFNYIDRNIEGVGKAEPAPDLNLLIAPVYAWLYKESGDTRYRQRADAIFAGGVALACLKCSGKIFNQNYRSSFDYITWRRLGDERYRKLTSDHNQPAKEIDR